MEVREMEVREMEVREMEVREMEVREIGEREIGEREIGEREIGERQQSPASNLRGANLQAPVEIYYWYGSKEEIERCKQRDLLEEMLSEMAGEFPALGTVFVNERDVYLTHSLQLAATPVAITASDRKFYQQLTLFVQTPPINVWVSNLTEVVGHRQDLTRVERQDVVFQRCNVLSSLDVYASAGLAQSLKFLFSALTFALVSSNGITCELSLVTSFLLLSLLVTFSLPLRNLLISAAYNLFRSLLVHVQVSEPYLRIGDVTPARVVGVVGIGHVPGIVQNWGKVTLQDIPPIMRLPRPSLSGRIIKFTCEGFCRWSGGLGPLKVGAFTQFGVCQVKCTRTLPA
uniref:Uncharacterized protein n=1 Tax=Timema tahoe TaxID=61484 RepID=A0A7R9IET7_9NEOP|nr:unnamed protein product [Timema tahoe]